MRPRSKLSAALGIIAWMCFVPLALSAAALFTGELDWRVDLVANLSAQALVVMAVFALLALLLRRWRLAGAVLLLCAIHIAILASHRAAWWPRGEPARSGSDAPGTLTVRFMHHNTSTRAQPQDILDLVARANVDVVALTEPPWTLWFSMKDGQRIAEGFGPEIWRDPFQYSRNVSVGPGCIATRWTVERYDASWVGELHREFIVGIITVPPGGSAPAGARFAVIGAHPRSPRTDERWRHGNETIRALVDVVRRLRSEGLPVIVLADLNSTPTGWRSRYLCSHAGLRRAKPLLQLQGTFPAGGRTADAPPWPASIAIDDAFVSEDMEVLSWRRADQIGSDHFAVYTTVRFTLPPSPPASGGTNSGK